VALYLYFATFFTFDERTHFRIIENFTLQVRGNPDKGIYRNAIIFLRTISNKTGVSINQGFVEFNDKI
jgi:hypothetical protein